jgi:hypothetical protein
MFDGMNIRLEFVINRFDEPKPPHPPTGHALTACRLVLSLPAILDMLGKLNPLIGTLQAQGVIRPVTIPSTDGRPN